MASDKRLLLGCSAVCGAAVLWAAGGTLAAHLAQRGADPVQLTAGRAWVAFICLIAYRPSSGDGPGALRKHFSLSTFWFGVILAVANSTYYIAVSRMDVAVAITIQYTAPLLVVVWTALIQKRRLPVIVWPGAVVVTVGVALLVGLPGDYEVPPEGLAFAVASALAFAAYAILAERVSGDSALLPLTIAFGWSSLIWIAVSAVVGIETILNFPLEVVLIGTVATVVPFGLFVAGVRLISGVAAVVTSTLEPVSAAVFASVFLSQMLTTGQLFGGALVIAGIIVVVSSTANGRTP